MSSGKLLLGVMAGVATGALLGILFAPDKGTDTRKKVSKKGRDYADSLKQKFNEFLESISEKFEEAKEEVSDYVGNGHEKSSGEAKKEKKTASA